MGNLNSGETGLKCIKRQIEKDDVEAHSKYSEKVKYPEKALLDMAHSSLKIEIVNRVRKTAKTDLLSSK